MATSTSGRPISPRLHSLIDYGLAAGNLTLPTLLGMSGCARAVFASFGLVQGGLNALTVQPYAVSRVVPFRVHGTVEKSSTPLFVGLPLLAGLNREPRARAFWLGLGVALVVVYNLTDWDARRTAR